MLSKTNAKHFALGLALALALAIAPQTLAGPAFGGDLSGVVVGFFADVWQTVVSWVGADDAGIGPWGVTGGEPQAVTQREDGLYLIPNGVELGGETSEHGPAVSAERAEGDSQDEIGAGVIPNG